MNGINTNNNVFIEHGYRANQNNGISPSSGRKYDYTKKLEVAQAINNAQNNMIYDGQPRINITAIQRECGVGWHFVDKIKNELEVHGRVLHPDEVQRKSDHYLGPGSKTLHNTDVEVLIELYMIDPSRNLKSYKKELEKAVGTKVSGSTISRFFREQFPFSMTFCQPNLVPFDKFRPENEFSAVEYAYTLARVAPHRVKCGDEKSMKGKEVFNKKVRRNPFTGEVPPILTTPDLTNTYSLTGFCGIDTRSSPVWCSIHDDTNDATEFAIQLEMAIHSGFFHRGDILVMDNAAIHVGGENTVLEDWLWDNFEIFLLFLPPRSPEWNPIELIWNALVERLKAIPLAEMHELGSHACAKAASRILGEFTHEEVRRFYKKANIL